MSTTFTYKVRDSGGKVLTGSVDAESTALAANRLRSMGYTPIEIDKKVGPGMKRDINIPGLSNRVPMKDISVFSRQFATMVNSGLTLLRSLSILATQAQSSHFKAVIEQVRTDIEQGSSLSQALARHPKQFNKLYLSMVRAGETGGSLDRTLNELSTIIEKQVELRGKIKSALTYPVAVLGLVCLILTAMLLFIVPIFKSMYSQLGGTLPTPTLVLVGISNIFANYFPYVVVLVVVLVVLYKRWVRTPSGQFTRDKLMLRVPVFGGLIRKTAMARFAGTLSTLMSSGVPVLESLDITRDTVGNVVVANAIKDVIEGVKQGEPMTRPLQDHPVFPPMVTQMMAVGDETGALDSLLMKVADFYQQEVERTVDAMTSLLEPLLIVVLGGAVGGMVISLYLPMFDIIKLVGNNN